MYIIWTVFHIGMPSRWNVFPCSFVGTTTTQWFHTSDTCMHASKPLTITEVMKPDQCMRISCTVWLVWVE